MFKVIIKSVNIEEWANFWTYSYFKNVELNDK